MFRSCHVRILSILIFDDFAARICKRFLRPNRIGDAELRAEEPLPARCHPRFWHKNLDRGLMMPNGKLADAKAISSIVSLLI